MNSEFRFGDRTVTRAGRAASVAGVFARVASRYDLMNDVMSAGWHRVWKRGMVSLAAPRPDEAWLDLAAGSGDIAAQLAQPGRAGVVVAADPSAPMLELARRRCAGNQRVRYVRCTAENLPFAGGRFAGVTCAFGLRNFTAAPLALAEVARVLQPGGRAVILEFAPPHGPLAAWHRRYLLEVLPALGQAIAGDAPSYRYLAESIMGFPPPAGVGQWLEAAGLVEPAWRTFAGGAVAVYRAWKTL